MALTAEATPQARTRHARATTARMHLSGPDRFVVAVLVIVPLVVFALPAVFGHAAIIGDDVTQNYPLRELVANLIRHGHLPLFDPYVWSGAPLLGGWNAGAAYPFTLLFVVFPGALAWTLTLVITWWVAGLGCFAFLRASRLAPVPSFLGSLSFSFAGAMTAQISHIGLVEGMSWTPVALLALLRMSQRLEGGDTGRQGRRATRHSLFGWAALLAVSGAMVFLAGEPRAVTDVAVIVVVYGAWRALKLGRRAGIYLLWAAGGLLLASALGAVQWLPGMAAIDSSQRAASNATFFTSGSLPDRWLLLLLVPDILGGSSSFGQPAFVGPYNLTEVTGYIGLMPLIGSLALLGRLRWRRPAPEWLVWQIVAIVGLLLALGGNTPLWHVLIRVPFFGGQRFQSRNIVVADMGFAFLLAYWSNSWLAARARRHVPAFVRSREAHFTWWRKRPGFVLIKARGADWRVRILGVLPGLLVVATVMVGFVWGAGLLRWLGASLQSAAGDDRLRLWFLPFGVLGLASAGLFVRGNRLGPARRKQALVAFVVADIITFTLMVVIPPLAYVGAISTGSSATSAPAPRTTSSGMKGTGDALSGDTYVTSSTTPGSAASYSGTGRFAVYDPDGIASDELSEIEAPDTNVVDSLASVQGYGSIVDAGYADATGTHSPTGERGDVLDPSAVEDGTLDELDTTALFAPRDYFLVSSKADPATAAPAEGERRLAPGGRATWYLGADMTVASILVPDAQATLDASSLRFALTSTSGATSWAAAIKTDGAHLLRVVFDRPVTAVALVAVAAGHGAALGSPSLAGPTGTYVADGQLEGAVLPPHWTFRGLDGSFAVFANSDAVAALTVRGPSGASVHAESGPAFAPTAAAVSSPEGTEVIRSEAAIPGWSATWNPDVGPTVTLPVRLVGIVQGVDVPKGSGVLTFTYDPPGWAAGYLISASALAVLLGLLGALLLRRRAAKAQAAVAATFS